MQSFPQELKELCFSESHFQRGDCYDGAVCVQLMERVESFHGPWKCFSASSNRWRSPPPAAPQLPSHTLRSTMRRSMTSCNHSSWKSNKHSRSVNSLSCCTPHEASHAHESLPAQLHAERSRCVTCPTAERRCCAAQSLCFNSYCGGAAGHGSSESRLAGAHGQEWRNPAAWAAAHQSSRYASCHGSRGQRQPEQSRTTH